MDAIKLLGQFNSELGKQWNQSDLRQQCQLVPKILESVSIDEASETVIVKLKPDVLDYLMT